MEPFHFRQFSLQHHKSTMKVGTDAILLGVWAGVENKKRILDVGTGSGVIALLTACRSKADIDAIDIDIDSCTEALGNFQNSPFGERMNVVHNSFDKFSEIITSRYDLIISNPPFFTSGIVSPKEQREHARHNKLLDHKQICKGSDRLLDNNGILAIVLPTAIAVDFITTAENHGLYLNRRLDIIPKHGLKANRTNMEFSRKVPVKPKKSEITLRNTNSEYTNEYKEIMNDYLVNIK